MDRASHTERERQIHIQRQRQRQTETETEIQSEQKETAGTQDFLFYLFINLYKDIYKIMFEKNLTINVNAVEGLIWLARPSLTYCS